MEHTPVIVPSGRLKPEILLAVIEEFVGREGTDYGVQEIPFESKCNAVRKQLDSGRAVIIFDPGTETTTILLANDPALREVLMSL